MWCVFEAVVAGVFYKHKVHGNKKRDEKEQTGPHADRKFYSVCRKGLFRILSRKIN